MHVYPRGFNEAAALNPRKTSLGPGGLGGTVAGFNEAAALKPRKTAGAYLAKYLTAEGFNEAAALKPRKTGHDRPRIKAKVDASMRPRH